LNNCQPQTILSIDGSLVAELLMHTRRFSSFLFAFSRARRYAVWHDLIPSPFWQ
jgi:hypothetical protein